MTATDIRKYLAAREDAVSKLKLRKTRKASTDSLLAQKMAAFDFADRTQLEQIVELRAFADLLPIGIEQSEAEITALDVEGLSLANGFIGSHIGPRCRALEARAREQVYKELAPHFDDEVALVQAVEKSKAIQSFENLCPAVQHRPPGGVVAFANQLLQIESKIAGLEKTVGAAVLA